MSSEEQKGFKCSECGEFIPCDAPDGSNTQMRRFATHVIREHEFKVISAVKEDGEVREL